MKRSRTIRLLLLGGVSAGALAGCNPSAQTQKPPLAENNVYTNDYYVPGVGYYHAPFRRWYPMRYNHFDQKSGRYYFGGQWATAPYQSITNISSPLPDAVQRAELMRTDITRGGFGSTASGFWIGS
jgi:hypothetical protein